MKVNDLWNYSNPYYVSQERTNLRLSHFGAIITIGSLWYFVIIIRWKEVSGFLLTSGFSLLTPEKVSDSNSKLLLHKSDVCNNNNCLCKTILGTILELFNAFFLNVYRGLKYSFTTHWNHAEPFLYRFMDTCPVVICL